MNDAYTLTVSNAATAGGTTADIVVTDTLPTGLTFVSAAGAGWTCGATGQVVTCTMTGVLAAGASSTITLAMAVGANAVPSVINQVTVSSVGEGAATLSDNAAIDLTAVNPNPSNPVGALSIIAFPSRDFVSISGLTLDQGPVVVTVRRGGLVVAASPRRRR